MHRFLLFLSLCTCASAQITVVSAASYQPEAFDDDDLVVLELIAGQVASAIAHLRQSDRLDSQVQRRESESEAIFANMADALLVVDADGRIVRLNHAARKLLCVENTSIMFGQPLDRELWGQWPLGAQEVAETLAPTCEGLLSLGRGRCSRCFSCAPLRDRFLARCGYLSFVLLQATHDAATSRLNAWAKLGDVSLARGTWATALRLVGSQDPA